MAQRFIVAVLVAGLLVACGDGGAHVPNPPPIGTERPEANTLLEPVADDSEQRPEADEQRPESNDQAPEVTALPGAQLDPPATGTGGRRGDDGPGRAGNANGNPGPGGDE